jgi:hypothetical protein
MDLIVCIVAFADSVEIYKHEELIAVGQDSRDQKLSAASSLQPRMFRLIE